MTRRLVGKVGVLVLIGVAVAVGLVPTIFLGAPQGGGAEASEPPTQAPASIAPASPVRLSLPDDAYDLAYDQARGLVWLAVMASSQPDWLYAVAQDGSVTSWPLPDSDYNGYVSQIEVDAAGAIWVSQEYALIRFDPESKSYQILDLAKSSPEALPGALDPASPNPGTWISALAPYGDGILVARNNVASLVAYDAHLKPLSTIPLPPELAGARDLLSVGNVIFVLGGRTNIDVLAMIDENGTVMHEAHALSGTPQSRLALMSDGSLLTTGTTSSIVSPDTARVEAGLTCQGLAASSIAAPDPRGGSVCYDDTTGAVRRDGSNAVLFQLPMVKGQVNDPISHMPVTVTAAPSPSAMIVDKDGTIWFFVLGTHELVGLPD